MAQKPQGQVQRLYLTNNIIAAEITPDIGGRLLSFLGKDKSNFLLVGAPVTSDPHPAVTPESGDIGYLGHEIWLGPQSEWWTHQKVNPKRAAQKAIWPPDPYLSLARYKILEDSQQEIVLQSPDSLVSGIQLTKTFALIPEKKHSLRVQVVAKNIRKQKVSRDIWFNTRTPSFTQVYVPVASMQDVRVNNLEDAQNGPLAPSISEGFLSLDMTKPPQDKLSRKGKVLVQPSAGWMAGFHDGQAFIVQFPLQAKSAIHPEQGQVELYNDFTPGDLKQGLLEMEWHAPYKTLAPGESMQAEQIWTILEYKGPETRAAQIAFLHEHAGELGLD